MLDEVVRDFVQTQPPKNMTDIAKILQSVQIAYQAITTKVKTKSEWLNNINEKICDLEKKKSLLMKYREENTSLKGEELKEARRIM
jgi:predicted patatin/cPLA2 family phospholipase